MISKTVQGEVGQVYRKVLDGGGRLLPYLKLISEACLYPHRSVWNPAAFLLLCWSAGLPIAALLPCWAADVLGQLPS